MKTVEDMPDEHQKPIGELIKVLGKTFRDGIKKIRSKDKDVARSAAAAAVMCAAVHDAREPFKVSGFLSDTLRGTTPLLAADRPEPQDSYEKQNERIQHCCNEVCEIGRKYQVLDFIEALQCTLGMYAMTNFGVAGVEIICNSILKKSKEIEEALNDLKAE